jgi:asparaginyl-tRNA synthetase
MQKMPQNKCNSSYFFLFLHLNLKILIIMEISTTTKREKIVGLLRSTNLDREICVKGWVRTKRGSKVVNFIALNDGSTINNIQVVVDINLVSEDLLKNITTGACISVIGKLVASQGKGQTVEIIAESVELLGEADADTYPLQKKGHSLEFLREIAHLRMRTNTFGAVMRIRHHMAFAIHKFYNDRGFFYLHTPIITGSDAEGAGQMFHVTAFEPNQAPILDGHVNYE